MYIKNYEDIPLWAWGIDEEDIVDAISSIDLYDLFMADEIDEIDDESDLIYNKKKFKYKKLLLL